MRKNLIAALLFCLTVELKAQTELNFFVQFHDKMLNYTDLNSPSTFLSERSLDRRVKFGIRIDSFDLPVTLAYIDNIREPGITIKYVSKWLNGAVISVEESEAAYRLKIKFFVDDVVYLGSTKKNGENSGKSGLVEQNQARSEDTEWSLSEDPRHYYGAAYSQINQINGIPLHLNGLTGKGIQIAVFDAGFYRANELRPFRHLFADKRLIGTFDLVYDDQDVYRDNDHGMNVLGVMAAKLPGEMVGTAPDADYMLFRTESKVYENLLEELNWVRAAEMADSLGIDIINSSLGYNTFDEKRLDHKHEQLDGKTAFISRGASIAASRGILVVNAAGNDGNKSWKKIAFPADAFGVLTVGASNLSKEAPAFSSMGPTADHRIKPEIAGLGYQTTITTTYGFTTANGTSFSCPLIAGMMACLMQGNPDASPKQLIETLINTGHLYYQPDNVLGYGIPDFLLTHTMLGHNQDFSYTESQFVYPITDTMSSNETLRMYFPSRNKASLRFHTSKRFLFIHYQKKIHESKLEIPESGFVSFSLSQLQTTKSRISLTVKQVGGPDGKSLPSLDKSFYLRN